MAHPIIVHSSLMILCVVSVVISLSFPIFFFPSVSLDINSVCPLEGMSSGVSHVTILDLSILSIVILNSSSACSKISAISEPGSDAYFVFLLLVSTFTEIQLSALPIILSVVLFFCFLGFFSVV